MDRQSCLCLLVSLATYGNDEGLSFYVIPQIPLFHRRGEKYREKGWWWWKKGDMLEPHHGATPLRHVPNPVAWFCKICNGGSPFLSIPKLKAMALPKLCVACVWWMTSICHAPKECVFVSIWGHNILWNQKIATIFGSWHFCMFGGYQLKCITLALYNWRASLFLLKFSTNYIIGFECYHLEFLYVILINFNFEIFVNYY